MYNPFDETNETLIPEAYAHRVNTTNKQRTVSSRRRYASEIKTIKAKRQSREIYLVIVGATVAGLLFGHMGYLM